MNSKKALIVTNNKYPDGNAGAVRQHIFAKALTDIGYSVKVVGMGETTNFCFKEYDGISYISLRAVKTDFLHKILNQLFFGKRIKKLVKKECPTLILVVDIPFVALKTLKKYAKKRNIPIIHDSVEWYSPEEFKHGMFALSYIHNNILNRYMINKNMRVIAISKYLKNHFDSRGINTCRIPFILDVKNIKYEKKLSQEKLVIVYAGMIGKKDHFNAVIEAMNLLDEREKSRIELKIIGTSRVDFIKGTGIEEEKINSLGNSVVFLGHVSRSVVIRNLSEANFTILIRPENLRYSQAGFPTKVTESLAYGTPVITNITSDLGDYLSDNYDSVIVKNTSSDAVLEALKRVLNMDKSQLEQLCINARHTAEEKLDYRCFYEEIISLTEN